MNMAGAKPHRRRESAGPSAWSMSVDLVNLPKARDCHICVGCHCPCSGF